MLTHSRTVSRFCFSVFEFVFATLVIPTFFFCTFFNPNPSQISSFSYLGGSPLPHAMDLNALSAPRDALLMLSASQSPPSHISPRISLPVASRTTGPSSTGSASTPTSVGSSANAEQGAISMQQIAFSSNPLNPSAAAQLVSAAGAGTMQQQQQLQQPVMGTTYHNRVSYDSAIAFLRRWFVEHVHHPYPTEKQKEMMLQATGLTPSQLNNWFTNCRKRDWKRFREDPQFRNIVDGQAKRARSEEKSHPNESSGRAKSHAAASAAKAVSMQAATGEEGIGVSSFIQPLRAKAPEVSSSSASSSSSSSVSSVSTIGTNNFSPSEWTNHSAAVSKQETSGYMGQSGASASPAVFLPSSNSSHAVTASMANLDPQTILKAENGVLKRQIQELKTSLARANSMILSFDQKHETIVSERDVLSVQCVQLQQQVQKLRDENEVLRNEAQEVEALRAQIISCREEAAAALMSLRMATEVPAPVEKPAKKPRQRKRPTPLVDSATSVAVVPVMVAPPFAAPAPTVTDVATDPFSVAEFFASEVGTGPDVAPHVHSEVQTQTHVDASVGCSVRNHVSVSTGVSTGSQTPNHAHSHFALDDFLLVE